MEQNKMSENNINLNLEELDEIVDFLISDGQDDPETPLFKKIADLYDSLE